MPHPKPIKIRSNNTQGSEREVPLSGVTFKELWDNFPSGKPYDNPGYTNQCAIRMSVTLHRVGVGMKSFNSKTIKPVSGAKTIGRIFLDDKPTATRAEEMGKWLQLQPFAGLPKAEDVTGSEWESKVKGRTGIIQFSRYWTRDGESTANASGGHIDLWNGSRMTISSVPGVISTFGRVFGLHELLPDTDFGWSDLRNSKQILFWEIK
ncbi:type VI secretion system amidase effector protein Tae4 [Burkholderia aenigmatica]|uniref:type VI secretion system amidase effector protein Tae4 n=1 Tax=Burkholderia aenigmatica TaxID=2015348 RepID=UPI00264DAC91|nr:type VI secretion system amidase effector protein Tae4 [Burkholderia aenigmatica]MDN7877194.1 type VI secretion system amidase effector protein Tae4 [Burkholderia aenigmatica]